MKLSNLIVQLLPLGIHLAEKIFTGKPKTGTQKKTLTLQIIQTSLVAALGLDLTAIGAPEQELISSMNDDLVTYYNKKGWPTE